MLLLSQMALLILKRLQFPQPLNLIQDFSFHRLLLLILLTSIRFPFSHLPFQGSFLLSLVLNVWFVSVELIVFLLDLLISLFGFLLFLRFIGFWSLEWVRVGLPWICWNSWSSRFMVDCCNSNRLYLYYLVWCFNLSSTN